MSELIEYECPCCGGKIEFDSTLQKPKCPYCDTEFDLETLKGYDEVLHREPVGEDIPEPTAEWSEDETAELRSYVCKSCGGEIITDATTAATHCPYCSNPVIMTDKFAGGLKPDLVIPFKLDKKAAKAALSRHLTGKKLLPRVFKDENHIDEIKGVYVPVWLYNAEADVDLSFRATRVRSWSDVNFRYTETSFFSVVRGGGVSYSGLPVDGSSKMDDTLMESIEPFDLSEAVDFQTAYLSGYLADRYDVDSDTSRKRADERMRRSAERVFTDTVSGYATVRLEYSKIRLNKSATRYALFPVWLLNTNWNGNRYFFAMNGQTGKFVGDLPCDNGIYMKWLFGLTAAIGAAVFVLLTLFLR